jgi:hypothetical protein
MGTIDIVEFNDIQADANVKADAWTNIEVSLPLEVRAQPTLLRPHRDDRALDEHRCLARHDRAASAVDSNRPGKGVKQAGREGAGLVGGGHVAHGIAQGVDDTIRIIRERLIVRPGSWVLLKHVNLHMGASRMAEVQGSQLWRGCTTDYTHTHTHTHTRARAHRAPCATVVDEIRATVRVVLVVVPGNGDGRGVNVGHGDSKAQSEFKATIRRGIRGKGRCEHALLIRGVADSSGRAAEVAAESKHIEQ